MKKLMRSKSRTAAYVLVLSLLFGMNSCRKDHINPIPINTVQNQLIKQEILMEWFANSDAAKILTVDWSKAKQAIVNGKNVVRIPTIFNDKISGNLYQNISEKQQTGNWAKTNQISTSNYDKTHPPELFFIENPKTDKLNTFLLNFIPKNLESETGKNGVWTGKLYEWNLTGDTVFIQQIDQNKVAEKYAIKLNQLKTNAQASKSVNSTTDKSTNGFWGKLWDKLGEFIGWIGSAFGLSEHVWDWYDNEMEWRINLEMDSSTGAEQNGEDSAEYGHYTYAGDLIYSSYIPGIYASDYNGGNIQSPVFYDYPDSGNPVNAADNSDAPLFLTNTLGLNVNQQSFLTNHIDLAISLKTYLDENGLTDNNMEYIKWAVGYFMENPSLSFSDLIEDISENYGDDDNNIIVVVPSTFISIPEKIVLDNGKVVNVVFGISDNKTSAKQKVHPKLVDALKAALNIATQGATINSIFISATTNGVHSPDSKHYKGIGLDISRINGIQMLISGNSIQVSSLQNAFESLPNIRENFGPNFIHKNKLPAIVSGHKDHIHITINL